LDTCPFCRIISGVLPGTIVHQDPVSLVIMDMQPINPGHMLVLPREHINRLSDLPAADGGHLFNLAQRLSRALFQSGIPCQGVNLLLSDGLMAGQEIPHLHLHVVPRHDGDGFGFQFSTRHAELPTREELAKNAYHIKQALLPE